MSKNITSVILFIVLLGGCSSIGLQDIFSGYTQQMQKSRNALQQGDYVRAENQLVNKGPNHNSFVLVELERGRLQYLQGDYSASKDTFEVAFQRIEQQQAKAKLQISRGLQKVGAVMSNDSVIGYEVAPYEQTMLHTYQALNYLNLGDFEGAMVEIRRANLVQERALKENEAELADAEHDFNERALKQHYPSMEQLVSEVKNGFQNAYTFYLSGVFYEARNALDDAYIDYKRALEIAPNNRYVQQDVLRLAKQLNMYDDEKMFAERFGDSAHSQSAVNASNNDASYGDVVFVVEQEIVKAKQEIRSNLPIFRHDDIRFFSFALPTYRGNLLPNKPLVVSYNEALYTSENLVKIQSLAAKQLQEQLPSIVARQAVRLVAKEQMRRKMSKEGDEIGNILMSLYNIASEHADTRSWITLPESVQILRLRLPVGAQNITLSIAGKTESMAVEVKNKGITLVSLSQIGIKTQTHVSQL